MDARRRVSGARDPRHLSVAEPEPELADAGAGAVAAAVGNRAFAGLVREAGPGGRLSRAPTPDAGTQTPDAGAAADQTDAAIEGLDLSETAKKGAYALKKAHPSVSFTSGKRTIDEQASAMAANVVSDGRDWIKKTYSSSSAITALQKWVDDNPKATTQADIAAGLKGVFDGLSEAQRNTVSKHLTGEAFDVQPVETDADMIKATMKGLPGATKFLEKEGNLVRWHVQF